MKKVIIVWYNDVFEIFKTETELIKRSYPETALKFQREHDGVKGVLDVEGIGEW